MAIVCTRPAPGENEGLNVEGFGGSPVCQAVVCQAVVCVALLFRPAVGDRSRDGDEL